MSKKSQTHFTTKITEGTKEMQKNDNTACTCLFVTLRNSAFSAVEVLSL